MRKILAITACCFAVGVTVGFWWDAGQGQSWMAVHTGVDYCPVPPNMLQSCKAYAFWSGFGSVIPWTLFSMGGLFAGLIVALRRINCHKRGCWRIGRYPIAGGEFKVCGRCQPDWEGKHPPAEYVMSRHEAHTGKEPRSE